MEIRIARADAPDAVLAHENSRVRVMKDIAGEKRQFCKDGRGNLRMSFRRNKNAESRRG